MRGADLAAGDKRAQGFGRLALAAVAAERMDARVERRVRAARRVERQRPGRERRAKQGLRLEEADQRVRGRELRAVEQREPLLRLERQRLEPDRGERFGRRHDPIVELRFADADHGGGHMGERREVARGADRALRRNDRRHAPVEHRGDAVDRLRPDAGGALREARQLQRHHEPRDRERRRLADAGGVRQHDVALKFCEIGLVDPHGAELAEAGVDSVDGLAALEDALDRRGARRDLGAGCGIEDDLAAAPDRAPVAEPGLAGAQHHGHRPLQTRACSGLKPIR